MQTPKKMKKIFQKDGQWHGEVSPTLWTFVDKRFRKGFKCSGPTRFDVECMINLWWGGWIAES